MKKFKFNEQSAIEKMIKSNFVDENNITNTIYSLAKYNHHALQLNDKENYNSVLKYILKNCDNIFEESIYTDITNCIKSAKKHKFASINEICITQSELDVIKKLNNILYFIIKKLRIVNNTITHFFQDIYLFLLHC